MTIYAVIPRFDPVGKPTECPPPRGGRVRRFVARHRLTDGERKNLRDYSRRTRTQSPAIVAAALGSHARGEKGQR